MADEKRFFNDVTNLRTAVAILLIVIFLIIIGVLLVDERLVRDEDGFWVSLVGLIVVPLISTLIFGFLNQSRFFSVRDGVVRSIENAADNQIETWQRRLEEQGTHFFTGVMKYHKDSSIFSGVGEPDNFRPDESNHCSSKILTIGYDENTLPAFIKSHLNKVATEEVDHNYKILYNNDKKIAEVRVNSILAEGNNNTEAKDYVSKNELNFLSLADLVIRSEKNSKGSIKVKEHSVYPFSLFLAHGNFIWISLLWNHKDARNDSIVLEIRRNSTFGDELEGAFDKIWSSSDEINVREIREKINKEK